jgi:hypothetical protein
MNNEPMYLMLKSPSNAIFIITKQEAKTYLEAYKQGHLSAILVGVEHLHLLANKSPSEWPGEYLFIAEIILPRVRDYKPETISDIYNSN